MSVLAVSMSTSHQFSKTPTASIKLIKNLGVDGDCHLGETVQHRSRLHIRPPPANLRQVHLISNEVLKQYDVKPSQLGENITTVGIDLLSLGAGTKLHFVPSTQNAGEGMHPIVVVTGLRNPCPQIEKFRKGLQEKFLVRDADRKIVGRKAGVMSTVQEGGIISPGMKIIVEKPVKHEPLGCV